MTASIAWPNFYLRMEAQVDNQGAAPAETRTPNLHRAKRSLIKECGWKDGDSANSAERNTVSTKKTKELT